MIKKALIPITLILLFGSLIFINGILPLLSAFQFVDFKFPTQYSYLIIIFSYISVIATLFLEKDNLATFNLDRPSLLVLFLAGFVRVNIGVPNETVYKIVIGVLGVIIFLFCIIEWKKIPKPSGRWLMVGIFACLIAIPIAISEKTQIEKYLVSNSLFEEKFIGYFIRNFIDQISFIAPFEEITYRGVLWGQLRKWNISDAKIFWIQVIPFWLTHFDQLFSPTSLWILFGSIIFSLLVRYSKQTFPSIVAHTLINLLVPILVMVFSRYF
jgi:membrane protease YdiL (CAAX protease family)